MSFLGNYAYIEASLKQENQTASLASPTLGATKSSFYASGTCISFKSYLEVNSSKMETPDLTPKELLDALNTLQSNKSPGFDEIGSNIVKQSRI